jgi:hypothetical protein
MHITGTIYQTDGKTLLGNMMIENWQFGEKKKYYQLAM